MTPMEVVVVIVVVVGGVGGAVVVGGARGEEVGVNDKWGWG